MKSGTPLLALALLTPLLLGGCGLRGPLYLPETGPQSGSQESAPTTSLETGKANPANPQPAPQAQKRDRTTQPAEQTAPQTAN